MTQGAHRHCVTVKEVLTRTHRIPRLILPRGCARTPGIWQDFWLGIRPREPPSHVVLTAVAGCSVVLPHSGGAAPDSHRVPSSRWRTRMHTTDQGLCLVAEFAGRHPHVNPIQR